MFVDVLQHERHTLTLMLRSGPVAVSSHPTDVGPVQMLLFRPPDTWMC